MSNCDCQKNIKKPFGDEVSITTVVATATKEPNGDRLLITTIATTVVIFLA